MSNQENINLDSNGSIDEGGKNVDIINPFLEEEDDPDHCIIASHTTMRCPYRKDVKNQPKGIMVQVKLGKMEEMLKQITPQNLCDIWFDFPDAVITYCNGKKLKGGYWKNPHISQVKYPVRVLEIFVDESVDTKKLKIPGDFKSLKCRAQWGQNY